MRYLITHVLEGIQAYRAEQITAAEARHSEACARVGELRLRLELVPQEVADFLEAQVAKLRTNTSFDRQQVELIRTDLLRLERSTPTPYDLDQAARKVDRLQGELDNLQAERQAQDTQLEQFLRAVQAGEETHVSQHALKQAGLDLKPITTYILARARVQPKEG